MTAKHQMVREKREFFDNAAAGWGMEFDDRDRDLLDRILNTFIRSLPGGNAPVLDIGCGTGVLFSYLNGIPFCGVDISFNMLARANTERVHNGIGLCQADAQIFPFSGDSVAGVIGFAVLPHLDNHDVFLSECHRVLIRGGVLSIAHLHAAREINAFHQSIGGAVSHDHLPEGNELADLASEHGFSIEVNETVEKYFFLARKL
jgi:SAM-dependent methyltransferase